jgi:hypothetical protein
MLIENEIVVSVLDEDAPFKLDNKNIEKSVQRCAEKITSSLREALKGYTFVIGDKLEITYTLSFVKEDDSPIQIVDSPSNWE